MSNKKSSKKDKGWEFLNSNDMIDYHNEDGSWGYKNKDGSASYYGSDGSWGYKNKDGTGSYYDTNTDEDNYENDENKLEIDEYDYDQKDNLSYNLGKATGNFLMGIIQGATSSATNSEYEHEDEYEYEYDYEDDYEDDYENDETYEEINSKYKIDTNYENSKGGTGNSILAFFIIILAIILAITLL